MPKAGNNRKLLVTMGNSRDSRGISGNRKEALTAPGKEARGGLSQPLANDVMDVDKTYRTPVLLHDEELGHRASRVHLHLL